ncbi:prolyl 3-hydroxylase 3 precursor, partial [Camelus ferus]
VVSFFSLKSDSAPPWMVLAVLWCSMAQTLLLPSFIWSCERYRADVRTVWEQCVAIMSEEDGDDDGGCDDYADGRVCKVRFDANGATGPGARDPTQVKLLPGRHMLFPPLERVHYLQVPLSRRLSHDETNIFSNPRAPGSFLHKWSSSDDIRVLPAQSRALGGPPEYLGQRQRPEDEEEEEKAEGGGLASLRQFLEGGALGSAGGPPRGPGFFREEITTFIDETPLPSPAASPGPSPRRPRPLGLSPRRLSLGSPDSRAIGLPLGLSAGRRCSLTGEDLLDSEEGAWLKKLDLAAAAAHTFFVANPTHLQMREDMAKYRRMTGVRPQSFRDLETPPYWAAYDTGLELLGRQEAGLALPWLEEALQESLAQMESCRADCEGPEEQQREEDEQEGTGSQGGLYEAIAVHWIRVLQCRQRCVGDTATRPGRSFPVPDFLPGQLKRLHEAYAQVGNLSQAVESVLSVLLFYPEDEASKKALDQYQAQLGEPRPSLGPREDIQSFVLRSLGEKRQLYYAMEHLGTSFKDPDPWTPAAVIPEALREKLREDQEKRPWDHEPPQPKPLTHWKDVLLLEGVTLTQDARQLNGSERAVLDGLLTPAECGVLLQLAKDAAEAGARSGYRGRRSPHTPHERFEGLTVLKAAQLARAGAVGSQGAQLLLEVSERVRTLTQAYFSPDRPLHLSFTHLVCRSAVEGEQAQRMDLSHPVHADNCVLDPDTGECWREPPAYTYRDYSGLLYLNDDFQGGDLFFTEPNALRVTAQVRPRCGRLVAFSSGGENPHGVWAVTRGRRCALALWHTWAPEHREQEWTEAKELLQEPEEEEEEMPSRDPAPEPPSRRLQRVQDKAGKPSRVREEL